MLLSLGPHKKIKYPLQIYYLFLKKENKFIKSSETCVSEKIEEEEIKTVLKQQAKKCKKVACLPLVNWWDRFIQIQFKNCVATFINKGKL